MVRDTIEWTKEEKKALQAVQHQTQAMIVREERRLLHNRASKEKGFHEYEPFRGKKEELVCMHCRKKCDLAQKGGINWKRAEQKCAENISDNVQDRKNKAKAELRNRNFEEWNNKEARGRKKHLYFFVDEHSCEMLACQREGCHLNTNPGKWPLIPRCLAQLANRCNGTVLASEAGEEPMEKKAIPAHLRF